MRSRYRRFAKHSKKLVLFVKVRYTHRDTCKCVTWDERCAVQVSYAVITTTKVRQQHAFPLPNLSESRRSISSGSSVVLASFWIDCLHRKWNRTLRNTSSVSLHYYTIVQEPFEPVLASELVNLKWEFEIFTFKRDRTNACFEFQWSCEKCASAIWAWKYFPEHERTNKL